MKKRNVKLVLLLELIILCAAVGFLCAGQLEIAWLIDLASIVGMLLFVIPSMAFMGVFRDFFRAFSVGQKHYSLLELKNISEAVSVCQSLVLFGGLIELLLSMIIVCAKYFGDVESIGPYIAIIMLSGLYTVILEYFLLPLKLNVQKTINEEIDFDEDE